MVFIDYDVNDIQNQKERIGGATATLTIRLTKGKPRKN